MHTTRRRGSFVFGAVALLLCSPVILLRAQGGASVFDLVAVEGNLSVGAEVASALSTSDTRAPDDAFLRRAENRQWP